MKFKINNTYEFHEGYTKCDPADPQIIETGTWAFTNGEAMLLIDTDEYIIHQLDDNTLIISYSKNISGDLYDFRFSLAH